MTNPAITPQETNKLAQFTMILSNAIQLISNPAFTAMTGDASIANYVSRLLRFGQTLLQSGEGSVEQMAQLNSHIQQLVDENRVPTNMEWDAWTARMSAVDERFRRVREGLAGEPPSV